MSTEFFNDQWRIPSNENKNKVSNYSMDFDGTSDKIEFGDVNGFDRTDAFSGSCWINLTSVNTTQLFFTKTKNSTIVGYQFYITASNSLVFFIGDFYSNNYLLARTNNTLNASTWYNIAFTYDGSSARTGIKLYVNSVLQSVNYQGPTSITGSIVDSLVPFQISGRDGANVLLDGKIDQVSIFDYALSASQVSTLYGGGTAITNPMSLSPKPIAYYQLGDESVDNGANYLVPNNSLSDYVFDFIPNDYIDCGGANDFSFTNGSGTDLPFSLSAWINMDDASGFRIISKYGSGTDIEWYFYTTGSDILRFRLYDKNNVGYIGRGYGTPLTSYQNKWINVVATYNGNEQESGIKLYINGLKVDDQPASSGTYQGMVTTTNPVTIGKMGTAYANGQISNTAIFNTELTSPQVQTIYNNGAPNDISSLSPTAWYKLNAADTFNSSTSTWTINDYGSGGNDGTSSGMDSSNLVVSDLQQTSGYSPYALDFDGINDYLDCGDSNTFSFGNGTADSPFSISAWINMDDATQFRIVSKAGLNGNEYFLTNGGDDKLNFILYNTGGSGNIRAKYDTALTSYQGQWIHVVGTYSGVNRQNGIELYLNGSLLTTLKVLNLPYTAMSNTTQPFEIGRSASSSYANGKFSNVSVFNIELSSTQVTEIYNSGRPSDLNTFSGTAPVAWWQLGSNSSFNTNWTCLDEIGTNNAVSAGSMTNNDIVDGPGYSASGLGTSSIDIKGDAPYSTANGLSENMDVLDRVRDTPTDLQPITNTHSIQLDGIDDYIDFGDSDNFSFGNGTTDSPFSISAWINMTDATQFRIANKQGDPSNLEYRFTISSGDMISLNLFDESTGGRIGRRYNTALTSYQGQWIHVVSTYDGSSASSGIRIYLNGVRVDDDSSDSGSYIAMENTTQPFFIGQQTGTFANGKMDEVAIFNVALTGLQVAAIYNGGTPNNILPLSPVLWSRFESLTTNSGVVTTADSSGNGLTGTVENGAVLSTNVP